MVKYLRLYNKNGELLKTSKSIEGNTGVITIENLFPETLYREGDFLVSWVINGNELSKAPVPEFRTLELMDNKTIVVYFSDITEEQLIALKGDSAYKIALDNGFRGTQQDWLESLKGEPGEQGEPGKNGVDITEGGSAYEIALAEGFKGTRKEWLESLKGEPGEPGEKGEKGEPGEDGFGVDGASAYEIALENGFRGNIQDFLDSLVGEPGRDGTDGIDGIDGIDGLSAYEIALENGFEGSEAEWLETLKGEPGKDGITSDVNIAKYPKQSGETSDNARIERAIENVPIQGTLYIPSTEEPIMLDNTLTINKNINVISDAKIVYKGIRDKNVLVFEGQSFTKIKLRGIYDVGSYPAYGGTNSYHGWSSENYVGITFKNMRDVTTYIGEIIGFTVGQKHQASNGRGHWFNNTTIEFHINNKIHIELNSDGDSSWMNSNKFLNSAFSYSGTPFITSTERVYCVKQTLTNGNIYGGNSNTFDNFKFETGSTSPSQWTMIYLLKAIGFVFRNYRFEFNSPATFAEIDLSSQDSTKEYVTHSTGNIFYPEFILGTGHELKFTNLGDIRVPRSEVAKIILPTNKQYTIYEYNDFSKNYRYLGNNFHTIKGVNRKPLKSTTLSEEVTYDYSTTDNLVNNNGQTTISGTYPVVIYLSNIKEDDEFTINKLAPVGSSSGVFIKCFDSNDTLIAQTDNNTNSLAMYGHYIQDYNTWSFHSIKSNTFTVNSPNVNKIAILITGTLRGFSITSTNTPNAIAKESVGKNNKNVFYSSTKPSSTRDFLYEELVFNSGNTLGDSYGWRLIDGVWTSIGTIK